MFYLFIFYSGGLCDALTTNFFIHWVPCEFFGLCRVYGWQWHALWPRDRGKPLSFRTMHFSKKCFSWQEKSPKAGDGLCRSFFQCLCFPPNVFLDYIFYIFWGIYMVSAFSWKIDFKQLFNIAFLISMYIIYMLTKNYKRPNHAQKTIRQNLYKYMPCTHPLQKLAQQRSWSWSQESHII